MNHFQRESAPLLDEKELFHAQIDLTERIMDEYEKKGKDEFVFTPLGIVTINAEESCCSLKDSEDGHTIFTATFDADIIHGLNDTDALKIEMILHQFDREDFRRARSMLQEEKLIHQDNDSQDQLFKRWSEAIYEHLEKAKRTAVSGQEVEIRSMVNRLIKHCESKEQSRLVVMLPAIGLIVAAIGFGVLTGLSVPVWLAGGYASGKPKLLTVEQVENLRWLKSHQGLLARKIVTWNSESLSNLNCTNNPEQRAVVNNVKGKYIARKSDYCLLRVKSP